MEEGKHKNRETHSASEVRTCMYTKKGTTHTAPTIHSNSSVTRAWGSPVRLSGFLSIWTGFLDSGKS